LDRRLPWLPDDWLRLHGLYRRIGRGHLSDRRLPLLPDDRLRLGGLDLLLDGRRCPLHRLLRCRCYLPGRR